MFSTVGDRDNTTGGTEQQGRCPGRYHCSTRLPKQRKFPWNVKEAAIAAIHTHPRTTTTRCRHVCVLLQWEREEFIRNICATSRVGGLGPAKHRWDPTRNQLSSVIWLEKYTDELYNKLIANVLKCCDFLWTNSLIKTSAIRLSQKTTVGQIDNLLNSALPSEKLIINPISKTPNPSIFL